MPGQLYSILLECLAAQLCKSFFFWNICFEALWYAISSFRLYNVCSAWTLVTLDVALC